MSKNIWYRINVSLFGQENHLVQLTALVTGPKFVPNIAHRDFRKYMCPSWIQETKLHNEKSVEYIFRLKFIVL